MEGTPQDVGEGRPAVSLSLQAGPTLNSAGVVAKRQMDRNQKRLPTKWQHGPASALHSIYGLWSVHSDTLLTATDAACMTHRQSQVAKWKSSPMQRVNPSQIRLHDSSVSTCEKASPPGAVCMSPPGCPAGASSEPANQPTRQLSATARH